jgi:hypothetical protein
MVRLSILLAVLSLSTKLRADCDTSAKHPLLPAGENALAVDLKNVHVQVDEGIVINVGELHGTLVPAPGRPPRFNELRPPGQATLNIERAVIWFTPQSVARLMNRDVLQGSNLHHVSIETGDDGKLHEHVWVHGIWPSSLTAGLTATDGVVHLRDAQFFGQSLVDMASVAHVDPSKGVCIRKNDIFIDPIRMFGSMMRAAGELTDARIEGKAIVERFGQPTNAAGLPPSITITSRERRVTVKPADPQQCFTLAALQTVWESAPDGASLTVPPSGCD